MSHFARFEVERLPVERLGIGDEIVDGSGFLTVAKTTKTGLGVTVYFQPRGQRHYPSALNEVFRKSTASLGASW